MTSQFRSQFDDENVARNFLEESRQKNQMIEEVLDKIRRENPDLDVILSRCLGW